MLAEANVGQRPTAPRSGQASRRTRARTPAGSTSRSSSRPWSCRAPSSRPTRAPTSTRTRTTRRRRLQDGDLLRARPATLTEYYGVDGHHLGRPADPPQPLRDPRDRRPRVSSSSTTATGCGSSAGSEDGNSYWLNNTLTQSIGETEMLAIATHDGRGRASCLRSASSGVRFALGSVLIVVVSRDRHRVRRSDLLRRCRRRHRADPRASASELTRARAGRALHDPPARLRPAGRRPARRQALGYDDAAAARSPGGRASRCSRSRAICSSAIPGYGTDKLNAAYSAGGPKLTLQTVRQLTGLQINEVDRRRLPGLRRRRRRCRLRLYRRRSGLLTCRPAHGLRRDRHQRRLSAALRAQGAAVRALPPHRQRHRPRRPPAGLPARGPAAHRGRPAGSRAGAATGCSTPSSTTRAFDPQRRRRRPRHRPVALRPPQRLDHAALGRGRPRARRTSSRARTRSTARSASSSDLDGSDGAEQDQAEQAGAGKKRQKKGKKKGGDDDQGADLPAADPQFEKYARTASRRLGFPVFYPTRLPRRAPPSTAARAPMSTRTRRTTRRRPTSWSCSGPNPSIVTEYFGVEGTTWSDPPILAQPLRDARRSTAASSCSSSRATGSAWSAGSRTATPTGSPTRCSRRSPRTRCSMIATPSTVERRQGLSGGCAPKAAA